MLCKIDNCFLVRRCSIINPQSIVVGQVVDNFYIEISWVSFLHVGAGISKLNGDTIIRSHFFNIPPDFVETSRTPMQVIAVVVLYESILLSVERKSSIGNPVAIAAYQRPEKRIAGFIGSKRVKSKGNINWISIPIRDDQRLDNSTIVHDFHNSSFTV